MVFVFADCLNAFCSIIKTYIKHGLPATLLYILISKFVDYKITSSTNYF
jgi:hypothetical protein